MPDIKAIPVFNKSGQVNRQVPIPGRNHTRRPGFGFIDLRNNMGHRDEGDWEAVKALIQAGNVAVPLSPWEGDRIWEEFKGLKLDFGGNVDIQPARNVPWAFVPDGTKATFEQAHRPEWFCAEHNEQFYRSLMWGRHLLKEHPEHEPSPEQQLRRQKAAEKRGRLAALPKRPKASSVKRAQRRQAQIAAQVEAATPALSEEDVKEVAEALS